MIVLHRDRYLCQRDECKQQKQARPASDVDHIVPKAQGGNDALTNLRALNKNCHQRITLLQFGKTSIERKRIGLDGWPVEDDCDK